MIKTMILSFLVLLMPMAHGAAVPPAGTVADSADDPAALATDSVPPARDGGGAAADNRSATERLMQIVQGYRDDLEAARTAQWTAQEEKIAALDCAHREQRAREAAERGRVTALRRAADEQASREAAEREREVALRAGNELSNQNLARLIRITQHGRLCEIFGESRPERLTLENIQIINGQYHALHNAAGAAEVNFDRVRRAFETFHCPVLLRTYQRNPIASDDRFLEIADCLVLPLPADVWPLNQRIDLRDDAVVDRCADALAIVTNNRYLLPNLDQHDAVALIQLLDYINNNPAAQAQFEAVRNHRAGLDQLFHEARYGKSYSKQLLLAGAVILITGYAANRYYQYQMKRFNEDINSITAAVKDENKVRALIAERRKWKYFLPGGAKTFNNNVMKKLLPVESVTPTS